MKIFDTHCHYNLEPFNQDWKQYWQKAQEHGVTNSTVVGVDLATSRTAVQLASQNSAFHAVIGCHPGYYQEELEKIDLSQAPAQMLNQALQLIEEHQSNLSSLDLKHVTAIGETGLDYFRLPESELANTVIAVQKAAFTMHLKLAEKHDLPVIIHARDVGERAYWDILEIIEKNKFSLPFVLHCVSGPSDYVHAAIQRGAYVGLAGNITYKNSTHLRELAEFAPKNRILIETDAPFLPPVPFRGKPCEPWMIDHTADYVEKELDLDLGQIYENSLGLFGVQ